MANAYANGFLRDSSGGIVVTTSASGAAYSNGFLRAPDGSLVVTTGTSGAYSNGFVRDSNGALLVTTTPGGSYSGGYVRDSNGALVVTTTEGGAYSGGFSRDASGALAVSGLSAPVDAAFVRDTFSGSPAGTLLTAHTGEKGATWTNHPNFTAGAATISSAGDVYDASASSIFMLASGVPPSADYTVEADIVFDSKITSSVCGLIARVDPTATTCVEVEYNVSGGSWQLMQRVAGALTTLGTNYVDTLTAPVTRHLKLTVQGANVTVNIDGTDQITATTTITAAGFAGMRLGGAVMADATGEHVDNFVATGL